MKTARLLQRIRQQLEAAGIESAAAEAVLLLEAATGLNRAEQLLRTSPLDGEEAARLDRLLSRRLNREPLQLILGSTHFYGLELQVSPGVLIPRPETETLVELSLERLKDVPQPLVIDIGTGTGAIALAIRSARPDTRVIATDTDEAALKLAEVNARRLNLPLTLSRADLLSDPLLQEQAAQADLIVSNPPYLPDSDRTAVSPEVQAEPATALYAGEDGLDLYRRLIGQAQQLLKRGSWLHLELDPRNVHAAAELAAGWNRKLIGKDLTGRERFLLLQA